ncbi:helix-turn-helix domain-containing protein [Zoogloea sp. LCSB751]|uniref:helix-turn-helix domain-containing protein n=1 Tax=Zoogloea sp. LCSB751 TaxID=1965277 RepID=UPI0009A49B9F|nr:helix-turn-helix domain-containing protein [Zoogloea sp. LCSB751]
MTDKKKGSPKDSTDRNPKPPAVTGQCAEVLELLRTEGTVLSFRLTAELAIHEAAARVHDLRAMGFHVQTKILPAVEFRGRIRRNVALYSLGVPSWPAPGFLKGGAA